ncbi:MAG TPA: 3-oxoacyl-[acyl-carrier-protein] synthase III C-terminal domain-containing protein [Anaerolineales bacterium]|jgi:alkylresorcinol/alkylpyrone synthase|nr:3-oxoacyl-[acyl-carrier-protein] synthase III C-terminal domain-containing protein [Anaerolineales bacterium]
MAHIVSAASAFPAYYYRQEEITAAMQKLWAGRPSSLERLESFHQNMQVNGRYLALPLEEYLRPSGFQERNQAWIRTATDLGEKVVCQLLEHANVSAEVIDQIVFTTITGIAAPSIDARLMNRIPFSPFLKRMPLFGLGCMGGAGGMSRLADYLVGHPKEAGLLLSVELCSLTIQHNDLSAENMVATGLFGDGAAAVLMVGRQHPLARTGQPRVIATRSVFFPETEHIMGWEMQDTGFKVVLGSDVAEIVETGLKPAMDSFLSEYGLSTAQIDLWLVHPGGPKIIQAIETGLGLEMGKLDSSRENLASVGNLSSAAVLVMLEKALKENPPSPGTHSLLMAMGPAFNAELILLEW